MSGLDERLPMPEMKERQPGGFGGYLRALRRSRGMTQRGLAAASRLDFTYLSKLENSRLPHGPSEAACISLAVALGADSWEVCRQAGKIPTPLAEKLLQMSVEEWRALV